jgi:hypothetical protein
VPLADGFTWYLWFLLPKITETARGVAVLFEAS